MADRCVSTTFPVMEPLVVCAAIDMAVTTNTVKPKANVLSRDRYRIARMRGTAALGTRIRLGDPMRVKLSQPHTSGKNFGCFLRNMTILRGPRNGLFES